MKLTSFFISVLLSAASAQGATLIGEVIDVWQADIVHFGGPLEKACIIYVMDDDDKQYGLVNAGEDWDCFQNWNLERMQGAKVYIDKSELEDIRSRSLLAELQRLDSSTFYQYVRNEKTIGLLNCRDVQSRRQARRCMTDWGKVANPEGEIESNVIATSSRKAREAMHKIFDTQFRRTRDESQIDSALAYGVVTVYLDAEEFEYYVVPRGRQVTPKKVASVNIYDVYEDYPENVDPLDFALGVEDDDRWPYSMFAGADDGGR